MPRYIFKMTADKETATALVQLAMDTATHVSIEMVEEDEPQAVAKRHHRPPGRTSHGEILALCLASVTRTASRARMSQALGRLGFSDGTVKAAISKLRATKKFEDYGNGGLKLLDDRTTEWQLSEAIKAMRKP